MSNRRIEYDPDDGSPYAQLLTQLDVYARAVGDEDQAAAAGAADLIRRLAEQLSDRALLAAVDGHVSGRAIAAQLGVVHGTVQYRIKQARERETTATTEEGPVPDAAAIAGRLRDTETESEGAAWLDELGLDRDGLLAVAGQLSLSRLERLSKPKIRERIVHQAITARRKFEGLRSGWQDD